MYHVWVDGFGGEPAHRLVEVTFATTPRSEMGSPSKISYTRGLKSPVVTAAEALDQTIFSANPVPPFPHVSWRTVGEAKVTVIGGPGFGPDEPEDGLNGRAVTMAMTSSTREVFANWTTGPTIWQRPRSRARAASDPSNESLHRRSETATTEEAAARTGAIAASETGSANSTST